MVNFEYWQWEMDKIMKIYPINYRKKWQGSSNFNKNLLKIKKEFE